jgi:hypothetical protein
MTKFESRKGRLITINGVKWKWQMSARHGVVAYCENGKKKYDWSHIVKGVDTRRGQWKSNSDGSITPADIRRWILGENIKIEFETEYVDKELLRKTAKALGVTLVEPVEVFLKSLDTEEIQKAIKTHGDNNRPLHLIFDSLSDMKVN